MQGYKHVGNENGGKGKCRERKMQGKGKCRERKMQGAKMQ